MWDWRVPWSDKADRIGYDMNIQMTDDVCLDFGFLRLCYLVTREYSEPHSSRVYRE